MSYEGTIEYLCANGHYWVEDAVSVMYSELSSIHCPDCASSPVAWNSIDQTNGCWPLDGLEILRDHSNCGLCSSWNFRGRLTRTPQPEPKVCPCCGHAEHQKPTFRLKD